MPANKRRQRMRSRCSQSSTSRATARFSKRRTGIGKHQCAGERNSTGEHGRARNWLRVAWAEERYRNHLQEKRAEIPQRTGFVEHSLGPPKDAALNPYELLCISSWSWELKVEIHTSEQSREGRCPEQPANRAQRLPLI